MKPAASKHLSKKTQKAKKVSSPNFDLPSARKLLLHGQGLLGSPQGKASPARVRQIIGELGFLQIDSINVLERAHHITLGTRLDGYRPSMLREALEDERWLFEDWTHDASVIPIEHYAHWHCRRLRFIQGIQNSHWWQERLGCEPQVLFDKILKRIEQEGALPTRAFKDPQRERQKWWGWSPVKASLEHLWRSGILAISRREKFEKVYDLTERVIPEVYRTAISAKEETLAWSTSMALKRLGCASSRELAQYWNIFKAPEVDAWCRSHLTESTELEGRHYWLRSDWLQVLETLPDAPKRLRLLCPFDPLIRDRSRLKRLFDFDYRFEAFVPAPKRLYGYYVLPMLMGEHIVGRADLKHDRKASRLVVKGLWWEPGVKPRPKALGAELARFARRIGANDVDHAI